MSHQSHSNIAPIDPLVLLQAYASGYFPMADSREGELNWYSPDPRAIIPLDTFHVPRSLRLTMKKKPYVITFDTRFEDVIRTCSERDETWISEAIIESYVVLHNMGYAHSIECWNDSRLAGGLYGVALGGAFFGESMFSKARDASKIALVYLVELLRKRGYILLDTQFTTEHLKRFGTTEIPRKAYLRLLDSALKLRCSFSS